MQQAYVKSIYKLIQKDSRVILCLSDSGTEYEEMIAYEFPNQVINFGISENNKVAAAAGLTVCSKIPFIYTTSAFIAYRSYEFIRDDICLQNKNVKMIGMGCGISWSTLGPTHHTTEDLSALKALPNLTIITPASPIEVGKAIEAAYEIEGPVYIRIGMSKEVEIYENAYTFQVGKNVVIREGKDAIIYTTGSIISEVMDACDILQEENIFVKVVNVHTLKPLDQHICKECKDFPLVFTVEEHNIIGGLGSSIADIIASNGIHTQLIKIGLLDCFAKGYGTYNEIKKMNNLDAQSIYRNIEKYLTANN